MAQRKRLAPTRAPVVDDDVEYEETSAVELQEDGTEDMVVKSVPRAPLHLDKTDARAGREGAHAPVRRRRRQSVINENIFHIPLEEIPAGSSYEWKRWTVHGMEDPFYIASMREQGWEPVDPKRHPNWVPPGYKEAFIIKGGQILMERPMELTKEARAEQRALSKRQVVEAEQRLGLTPKGTGTRDLKGIQPQIVKEVGRMVSAIEE